MRVQGPWKVSTDLSRWFQYAIAEDPPLTHSSPISPGAAGSPVSATTLSAYPGTAFPEAP